MLMGVLDWHTLGIKLGIPDHSLAEIRINYRAYGIGRQKQEMITKWLEYDTEASWDKLANALKEMGKHVAAAKIWNIYVTGYRGKTALVLVNDKMSIDISVLQFFVRKATKFSLEKYLSTIICIICGQS